MVTHILIPTSLLILLLFWKWYSSFLLPRKSVVSFQKKSPIDVIITTVLTHSLTYHLYHDISLSRNFDHNIIISIFVTGCTGGLCHPTSGWRRRVPMENRGEQINTTTAIYDTSIIITTTIATTWSKPLPIQWCRLPILHFTILSFWRLRSTLFSAPMCSLSFVNSFNRGKCPNFLPALW